MADANVQQSNNTVGQTDTTQQTLPPSTGPQPFNEARFLKNLAEAQERFRRENPDIPASVTDLKLETQWWKPLGDLSTAMNNGSVPKEINEALQAANKDFTAAKYSRVAFDKFAIEARSLLAGHDEVLRVIEETILKTPEVWEKMHKYVISQQQPEGQPENST